MRPCFLFLGVVFWLGAAPAAAAKWTVLYGEDPLRGQSYIHIDQLATNDGSISVAAKCYEGDPDSAFVSIFTDLPYDDSADYPEVTPTPFKRDSEPAVEVGLRTAKFDRRLVLHTEVGASDVEMLLDLISGAQKRIVVGAFNQPFLFSARGSMRAVQELTDFCEISLANPGSAENSTSPVLGR